MGKAGHWRAKAVKLPMHEVGVLLFFLVGTGKELVLSIGLVEVIGQLEEVVVTADKQTAAKSELPAASARSFSVEESKRYAGSVGDPARMASSFAGVTGASDESNALIKSTRLLI